MRVRADIAALLHEGHSNTYIAMVLGCHRTTVYRARQALRMTPTGPVPAMQRLYAEAFPTGRVAEYRPARMPTSEAQAAANRARLLAALRNEAA
ncbi:helix-turn-helix domain-containing protein [Streptomyces violaceusniger]|uniref:helix-turn-helix domain-containing protein n=1 Tax=Streptomyces violaceusniger TaxID=68280 RepID=UPI00381DC0AB